jgi:hypothetical protein
MCRGAAGATPDGAGALEPQAASIMSAAGIPHATTVGHTTGILTLQSRQGAMCEVHAVLEDS